MGAKHNLSVGDGLSFLLQVDPSSCQVVDATYSARSEFTLDPPEFTSFCH